MRVESAHPEPMLEQAPSPHAGSHRACASPGQRLAQRGPGADDVVLDAPLLQRQQEVRRVVRLVGAQRRGFQAQSPLHPVEHLQGALSLGMPVGLAHADIHADPVAVLHEHVHAVLEVRHPRGLGVQPRLRVGHAAVRLVAPLLATEVHPRVAHAPPIPVRVIVAVAIQAFTPLRRRLEPLDLLEALERGVALQERAVDGEVVLADETGLEGHHHDAVAELLGNVQAVQPLAVDAEDAVIKARLVGGHVQEPAQEHVEGDPLAQRTLRSQRVQAHQHQGLEQPLGRDAGAAALFGRGVRRGERAAHRRQRLVGHPLDGTQRMIRGNHLLQIDLDEQIALTGGVSSHAAIFAAREPAAF
jgi:hypothetical protein